MIIFDDFVILSNYNEEYVIVMFDRIILQMHLAHRQRRPLMFYNEA